MTAPTGPISPGPSWAVDLRQYQGATLLPHCGLQARLRLDRPSLRVGRSGDDEQAAAGLVGAGDECAHGPESKVGVDSKGVSGERRVGSEVRLSVGIVRGSDISPLGIQDDQESVPLGFGESGAGASGSLATRAARRRLPGV